MWWRGLWPGLNIICDLNVCSPAVIFACGVIWVVGAGRDASGTKGRPGVQRLRGNFWDGC